MYKWNLPKLKKIITRLAPLVLLVALLATTNSSLKFRHVDLNYEITPTQVSRYLPNRFQKTQIANCIRLKIKQMNFLTPIDVIKQQVRRCIPEQFIYSVDKTPNTLKVNIPNVRFLAKYTNPQLNVYGFIFKQEGTYKTLILGTPIPEDFQHPMPGLYDFVYISNNQYPKNLKKIFIIADALHQIPEFRVTKIEYVKHPAYPTLLKIYINDNFFFILDPNQTLEDLENNINKALLVYKYYQKLNLQFKYIDLRFDRIVVK